MIECTEGNPAIECTEYCGNIQRFFAYCPGYYYTIGVHLHTRVYRMRLSPRIFVSLSVLFISCSRQQTETTIIPEDQFSDLYARQLVLQEEANILGIDSTGLRIRLDSLFRAERVTPAQVRETLQEYKKDLPRWRHFQEITLKRLEAIQRGDSANGGRRKM